MKKIVLFASFVAMVAFSACTSKPAENATEETTTTVVEEETTAPVEEAPVDSAAVETPAPAAE
ncbi:MAG: hypothetical protein LBR64_04575 [Dysgonamonadaceae bacterium]|nr:hypothetical protein [Dysgonamonadaceae bacterium]